MNNSTSTSCRLQTKFWDSQLSFALKHTLFKQASTSGANFNNQRNDCDHECKNDDTNKQAKIWTGKLTDVIKNGCSSPSTLYKTQKCVEGIPPVTSNPPLFCCPFCEKAKQTKNHGGPRSMKEIIIPGQMFHMDISFVSGPSNLKQILENGTKPNKTIKKSREGYIGFLTIIDAAS